MKVVVAWAAATALVSAVAWQVVGAAEDRVSDPPLTRVIAISPETTTGASASSTTPTTAPPAVNGPSSAPPTSTPTTATGATSTGASRGTGTPTTATTTTATTADSPAWASKAITSPAGVVIVSYRPNEVRLEAINPVPGWQYEVAKAETAETEVRFTSPGHGEVVVKAAWNDGSLTTAVHANGNTDESD